MTFNTGDLAHEILARGGHGHGHTTHTSTGGTDYGDDSDSSTDWVIWPVLAIGVIVFVVTLAKKLRSR
ncbi:hypothetical protein AB0I10_21000 [Streptomyces sp. NPDC050636]|uniref:hypothetical protein n=1 Tax=Streptomyces sp. NPDC050636 TaxID=3154510 RepID=UPI003422BFCE